MINQEMTNEVLKHFPEKHHELLKKQILLIANTLEQNKMKYHYSEDFKLAMDIITQQILNGLYLGINPLDK